MARFLGAIGSIGSIRVFNGERARGWRGGQGETSALALLGMLTVALAGAFSLDLRSSATAERAAAARSIATRQAAAGAPAAPSQAARRRALAAYGQLPLSFAQNAGRTDGRVRYLAQAGGSSFFFTERGVALAFTKRTGASEPPSAVAARGALASAREPTRPTSRGVALQLRFVDANPDASLEVGQRGAGTLNYLVGTRGAWRRGLPTYRALTYRELWPGVDVVFRGRGGTLKYEFHVARGADVRAIRL